MSSYTVLCKWTNVYEYERTKELPHLHGISKKKENTATATATIRLQVSCLFCSFFSAAAAAAISFHISGSFKSPLIHADHYHVRRDLNTHKKREIQNTRACERTNERCEAVGRMWMNDRKMARKKTNTLSQRPRLCDCVTVSKEKSWNLI